jgi:hypothetical protein
MSRSSHVVLASLAALAIGLVCASAALASRPEFERPDAKSAPFGAQLGSALAVPTSTALPEFYVKGAPLGEKKKDAFKGVIGETVFLPEDFGVSGGCASGQTKGDAVGPKTIRKDVITLFGCHITHGGEREPCSTKAKGEEIKLNKLEGELVYLGAGATLPVGLRVKPESGDVIAELHCGPFMVVDSGESLSEVGPTGAETTHLTSVRESNGERTAPRWTQVEETGPLIEEREYAKGHPEEEGTLVWETSLETLTYKTPLEVRG